MSDDLISRQAVIDEIFNMPCKSDEDGYVWIIRGVAWKRIGDLPSAEPTQTNTSNTLNALDCVDLISRQAAIDALTEYWHSIEDMHKSLDGETAVYVDCKVIIRNLPSSEPQRKKGKWINHDNSRECPFCHTEWNYFDNEVEWFNYCPNCGSDNRGESDD